MPKVVILTSQHHVRHMRSPFLRTMCVTIRIIVVIIIAVITMITVVISNSKIVHYIYIYIYIVRRLYYQDPRSNPSLENYPRGARAPFRAGFMSSPTVLQLSAPRLRGPHPGAG